MNYQNRLGIASGGGAQTMAGSNQTVGGQFNTSFSTGGSATGPALVLVGLVVLLVLDYVWTKGQQGGR